MKQNLKNSNITNYTPETLDALIDLWNLDSSKLLCTKEFFVNAIGSAFGHYLVKTNGMKWALLTDEYGTDFTLIHDEFKLTNYPLVSVAKAIDQQRKGSLKDIFLLSKQKRLELEKENKIN